MRAFVKIKMSAK